MVLHVCFTMDCERIAAESPPGGPATWELSERAIRGYCARLLPRGMPPTLFLTPECAARHRSMFSDLAGAGVELGLHVHPQSLGDYRYDKYLGEYAGDEQREVLTLAVERWSAALGRAPRSFRGGNFSASDATFGILAQMGFDRGSVSDPGRVAPGYSAAWRAALPDVHWASSVDRLAAGDLPFLEFPLTTDPQRLQPNGFPYELRLESGSAAEWHRPIIERAMARMEQDQVPFRALVLFTHNYFDYGDADAPQTRTLEDVLRALQECAAGAGHSAEGCTLGAARDEYVATVGAPGTYPSTSIGGQA